MPHSPGGGGFIAVRDTGPGVPEALQVTIFEAFRQAESFITRGQGGAGLGLTLARALVLAMGGQLELQSEIGVGSCFTVVLPKAAMGAQDGTA